MTDETYKSFTDIFTMLKLDAMRQGMSDLAAVYNLTIVRLIVDQAKRKR